MDTLEILREKGFIQTAQRAMHEFDPHETGRKTDNLVIAPGDEIIVDPDVGQEDGRCWRAVEKHLSRFVANGNAFERRLGDKARQFLANAGREAQVFGSAIDRNLKEIARAGAKSLWLGIFRSSNSRANEIEVTKKLKGPTLQDFLVGKNAMPDSRLYVAEDRLALENANRCRIYEIESAGILFRIFAIFVAPFSGDGAPCDDLAVVHDLLVKENGYHLNTGFLSTPDLCRVLAENGYTDTAYKLLLQEECPGWLYEVKRGATTIWETWDGVRPDGTVHDSLNHYSYGAICGWLFDGVCGIQLEAGKLTIRPYPHSSLGHAEAKWLSPMGEIRSEWRYENDRILMNIAVPVPAEIMLPDGGKYQVKAGAYSYEVSL